MTGHKTYILERKKKRFKLATYVSYDLCRARDDYKALETTVGVQDMNPDMLKRLIIYHNKEFIAIFYRGTPKGV